MYAKKHPLKNGDYAMDHSSIVYVMGPDGTYLGVVPDNAKPVLMARMLQSARRLNGKSFLVLFFKKEQTFFLKKEAKTFVMFAGVG